MNGALVVVLGFMGMFGLIHAEQDPALPHWDDGERKSLEESGWIAGAALLANDAQEAADGTAEEPVEFELPNPEEIADDNAPVTMVPEEFLSDYFAARPEKFLIDPQGLLNATDSADRLAFLDYHSSDSTIDLFVYLIGGDQEIPSEVRYEEISERFFNDGRPAAIILYYLGAPQRTGLYLSPSLTDTISAQEQRRALDSSVMQAFEKSDPSGQLERFLVQMSIRIYWMERKIGGQIATSDEAGNLAVSPPPVATRDAAPMKFENVRLLAVRHAIPATVLLGTLLGALGIVKWARSRSLYRFPDFEVEPRLCGPHAAGVGAVISFASASQPPATQRDQMPEYLRRA